ncbi:MAG: sirohydrochlorin chelatase, partial [Nitrospinae bacterium]|nr:sirohydrochlorin chelatase [Nitrospinota bacterium]
MNDTILLVGHGSRNEAGNGEVRAFAEGWRRRHPDWRIELCFIEFATPGLDDGLAKAAAHGGRVVVVPLILNAAGHVKMEIPASIDKARGCLPHGSASLPMKLAEANRENDGATFVLARNIGACEPVFDILKRRLAEADDATDAATTGVILLGRGSSDRGANGEVAKLVRWLYEETPYENVELAFTGITTPRLESVVSRMVTLGARRLVILPYYLFT